jgi:hypothetical protein
VERFFFDTDFLLGAALLCAEEAAPGQLRVTRQAWRIAAGLRPEARDLRLTVVAGSGERGGDPEAGNAIPASGYVGSYPLRARREGAEEGELGPFTRYVTISMLFFSPKRSVPIPACLTADPPSPRPWPSATASQRQLPRHS